jgi:thioester reductase-like protein
MNFLYENSSIDQMTEQLIQSNSISNQDPFHYQLTEQIIDKYIQLIKQNPIQSIQQNTKSERVFLVTGANGSLGSFIIRDLLKQSIQQRKLNISLLDQRLIILSSSMNLTDEHLGQTDQIYQELQNEITDIIHSAWKMNFNQTIKDFEYDSILGVFNLLKLSASNNIQFHFISSISSAASGLFSQIKEEPLPRNSQIALPQGYGQSKYAAEHLCWAARDLWSIYSIFISFIYYLFIFRCYNKYLSCWSSKW